MNLQEYEKVMDNVDEYISKIENEYIEEEGLQGLIVEEIPELTEEDITELDSLFCY